MYVSVFNLAEILLGFIKYVGPLIVVLFSVYLIFQLIKWDEKIKLWTSEVFKNPLRVILFIALAAFGIYAWFEWVVPILP